MDNAGFVNLDLPLGIDKVHIYMGEYRTWEKQKLLKINTQSYDVTNQFLDNLYEYVKLAPELTQEQHQILVDNINHLHDPIKFPDAPKAQVKSSSASELAYRYLVTYISALKSLNFIYPTIEMGQAARNNVTGVVTSPDFFKPHYYHLNHFLRQHYWITMPDSEHRETFLDDGEADNRLKTALEELKLGEMTDVFYHSIRSLNYASTLPFFKNAQTRARYDLKIKPIQIEQTEANERNWIELQFEPNTLFCISKASEGYKVTGELDNNGFARIEIPLALSHVNEFDIAYTFKDLPWYKKHQARLFGAIQLMGGVGTIIVAAATSPAAATGAGAAVSLGIAVVGMDNMIAGYTAVVNNQNTRTLGEDALIALGVPEPFAGATYGAFELGGIATAIKLAVKNGTMKTVQITLSKTVNGQIDELGLFGAKVNRQHELSLGELKAGEVNGASVAETGARQILNPNTIAGWEGADDAYNLIRTSRTDAGMISKNIDWSQSRVDRVKEHIFFREHLLDSGVKRFDADPDIVNAWNRMIEGDYVPLDIDLMRHEIFESKFEGIFKTNYRTAHDATIRSGRVWIPE